MRLLMREIGGEFDHVIVDSPPILGLADAPLLSRSVEGCAFVVEAEGVPVRGLRSALARLQQAQGRIYGVIVTRLNQKQTGYGYGYGYGYGKSDEA
jgi:Mrp family chromosome partitioning ATPase